MKKAVFFDIDGTLWNEEMQIPRSTIDAVQASHQMGNYAFLCTGRSKTNIRRKELLDIGFDGMIAACGTHIEFQGEKVYERLLTQEELTHALAVLEKNGASVIMEGPEYLYAPTDDFKGDPYVEQLRLELGEDIKDIKEITGNFDCEVNKISAWLGKADLETAKEELGEKFAVIHHGEGVVEIQPSGHSKATGIKKVCELLEMEQTDTYAFGDSANDLEMLAYVGHGIAMGNACKEAKEIAEFVTADIMEDGIKVGLEHYGLI